MMEGQQRTEISSIGEFGLIDRITETVEIKNESTLKGIGDDAAVLNAKGISQLISTDILVEDIHFDLMYTPLTHLGYKAVTTNLSDVYAMNAFPKQIVISMAISNRFSVEAIEEIYKGVKHACKRYHVDLVGGDTTASKKGLIINVTVIGERDDDKIAYRSGARVGDLICVSGDLGGAYIGLQLLEREKRIYQENPDVKVDLEDKSYIVERQIKPEARKDVIEYLDDKKIVPTSMIDISDGLSSEILHVCKASSVGCQLEEEQLPIATETFNQALEFNLGPTTCALSGGEDYELLFTIDPTQRDLIDAHHDITVIGEILDENQGAKLLTKGGNLHDIISLGWNSLEE
ncbi:MAG: thiamine-phosphate kinase [Bacteroidetes bacterium]|nr:thiamine-phosphate kinase [Bacteroidota bacterium]